jgi:hypothetical protein
MVVGNKYGRLARTALLCLAAAFLNSGTNYVVLNLVRLPLFCDTIMTVTVTFYAGLVPGIITGALTNMIMPRLSVLFDSPGSYLFALCNIAVALVTALLMRLFPVITFDEGEKIAPLRGRARERRVRQAVDICIVLFILSIALTLVISVMGGLISAFMMADSAGPEMRLRFGLYQSGFPAAAVEILSRIPVNMIDRPISVFAGFGVAALLRGVRRKFKRHTL